MPHIFSAGVLQLWDVGSHVRSLQMAANYLQGSDAVVIVYDVTQHEVRQSVCVLGWAWVDAQQAERTVHGNSCPALLQTYTAALSWLDIVQQMFQESGVPLVALVGNKADTADLQAAAVQLPVPQAAPGSLSCCCASYPAVSAKTGHNVQHMAASISAQLAGRPLQLLPAAEAVGVLEAHGSRKQTRHQPLTRVLRQVLGRVLCCCCMR